MKLNLFFSALFAFAIVSTTSCKKDPKPSVIGFWEGSSGQGANNTGTYNAIFFTSGTEVTGYINGTDTSNADKTFGTYTLMNEKVTILFKNNTFTYVGTVNNNKINGTWDLIPKDPNVTGHFIVTKK